MSEVRSMIERLRATRPGYDVEQTWHKFLLDAYAGTGGFQGRVRMPFASYWGAAADIYSANRVALNSSAFSKEEQDIDTYLDRFLREDLEKFSLRVATSQYPNYIEPIVDIRLSYMHRKDMIRTGTDPVSDFIKDANGLGTPWDVLKKREIDLRSALLGWAPVLFDRTRPPGVEPGQTMSREQATQLGIKVVAIPLYPGNLLDWDTDEHGVFEWVKLSTWDVKRPDPLGPPVRIQCIAIWERHRVRRWEIVRTDKDKEDELVPISDTLHNYGKVPVLIAKHKPSHDDPVMGQPMAAGPAKLARKLFNYLSEMDDHIRGSVFAFLQVPVKSNPKRGEFSLGNSNAMPIPMDSQRDLKYIAPPASVAETLEERIKNTTEEIYRTGRTEFARVGMSGQQESGAAKLVAFENTNRAIADFASNSATFDQEALRFVAQLEGRPGEGIYTTAPKRFDIEELSRELDEALTAISVDLGSVAIAEIKKRLVSKVLPNLPEDVHESIVEQIDEIAERAEQGRTADGLMDDVENGGE